MAVPVGKRAAGLPVFSTALMDPVVVELSSGVENPARFLELSLSETLAHT